MIILHWLNLCAIFFVTGQNGGLQPEQFEDEQQGAQVPQLNQEQPVEPVVPVVEQNNQQAAAAAGQQIGAGAANQAPAQQQQGVDEGLAVVANNGGCQAGNSKLNFYAYNNYILIRHWLAYYYLQQFRFYFAEFIIHSLDYT